MKPIIGIKEGKLTHIIYWKQFRDHLSFLRKDEQNFERLILSGLFLSLVLEAYITYIIEYLLEYVNREQNRSIRRIWENNFRDSAQLNKKFAFLCDIYLKDSQNLKERKKVQIFIEKRIRPLRNKIIHAHEFSIVRWSDGKEKKSSLALELTPKEIYKLEDELIKCIQLIEAIINKLAMNEFINGSSRKAVIGSLKFGIDLRKN